jgi:hypothetical protein
VGVGRDRGVPKPPRRLSDTAFLGEVERACLGLPGATVEQRDGYLAVTLVLRHPVAGLSDRAEALLNAFPAADGTSTVRVDVRNRHWAALVLELAQAAAARVADTGDER